MFNYEGSIESAEKTIISKNRGLGGTCKRVSGLDYVSELDRKKIDEPVDPGAFDTRHSPVRNTSRDTVIECVNQDVSEGDYALVVADLGNHGAVDSNELLHKQVFLSALSIARSKGS